MTSTPFFKPVYRIVSAIAMAAVTVVAQPAASSLAAAESPAAAPQASSQPQAGNTGAFFSPGQCLTADWSPGDEILFTVPPVGPSDISVAVSAKVALNASTLQYQLYNPNSGYTDWKTIPISDYVQFDSQTIVMTASNVLPVAPVNNSFQAIQFRLSAEVGSQQLCSPVHKIFAVNSLVRMPLLIQNYAVTNIAPVGYVGNPTQPFYNNTICRAVNIWPGATYSARFAEVENLFQVSTLTTSTLTVTVSGFTTDGQIQLRRSLGACDTGDFYRYTAASPPAPDPSVFQSTPSQTRVMVVNNVTPGKSYLRVRSSDSIAPNTAYQMNIAFGPPKNDSPFEPNNTACTAASISPNVTYQAYPDDASDWYSFTLGTPLNVQFTFTNFLVSGAGQFIVYKSDNCAALGTALTVQDKSAASYGPVPLQIGKYFIRIAVASGFQNQYLYNLRVQLSALATWNPKFDICAALTGCSSSFSSNQFTVYWKDTPNMNLLRLRLLNRGAIGGCPAGPTVDPITADPSEWGATGDWTIGSVPNGSYDVIVFTTSSLGESHTSPTFRVNINCDPNNATWNPHFDICPALTGCTSNFTSNQFTVYWTGTPNMNLLRMRLANRGATGNCPSAPTVDPITADPSEWGASGDWTILTVPTGSYDMSIYSTNTGGQQHASPVFRVNINCTPSALADASAQTKGDKGDKGDNVDMIPHGISAARSSTEQVGEPMPTVIPEGPEAGPEPTAIP